MLFVSSARVDAGSGPGYNAAIILWISMAGPSPAHESPIAQFGAMISLPPVLFRF
jgi:hypothetical protein